MSFFELRRPTTTERPLLVEVPHAGLAIPEIVSGDVKAPADGVLRDADIYMDDISAGAPSAGGSLLTAKVSRYVVDLNRAADDVDAATVPDHPRPRASQPRGVVWRIGTDGKSVLRKPLTYVELKERLALFHEPYHAALQAELIRMREMFGYAILIAAHSMPSVGRVAHGDPGAIRADVVPGTRGRTSADGRVIDLVDAHFRAAGLRVRHDDPYRGGFTTGFYGRPSEHWHAVQIELNRALYVDEENKSYECIGDWFEAHGNRLQYAAN
ncbi:MAG: N-formylglutamate amidohydrolase, partial [Polyangiaceae bacterium]|nr:N-formylglutamate amidohydrolase [Polyangiaceae bacterium]